MKIARISENHHQCTNNISDNVQCFNTQTVDSTKKVMQRLSEKVHNHII